MRSRIRTRLEAAARRLLRPLGLYHLDVRLKRALGVAKPHMTHPPYPAAVQALVRRSVDVVRYGAVALALHRIQEAGIPGDLAEVGVYRGDLSTLLRTAAPDRMLHLFDTFAGFPPGDLEPGEEADDRFRDTSVDVVRRRLGEGVNIKFHPGYFPGTAAAVAARTFAFVMVDVDKYAPTLAALEFFYPRLSPGGYLFVHDYNRRESGRAVARAVDHFFADTPERPVELPDAGGSIVVRRLGPFSGTA